ncbi:hypothetical protein [Humidesulfovibrio idahonensis]
MRALSFRKLLLPALLLLGILALRFDLPTALALAALVLCGAALAAKRAGRR